jgi:hypothetical protein
MNLETLLQHATPEELAALTGLIKRIAARPAVLVTVRHGSGQRRYVVDLADEETLRPYVGKSQAELAEASRGMAGMLSFGCQWLRGFGRVDEMARTLSLYEVLKVEEVPRRRVRGDT